MKDKTIYLSVNVPKELHVNELVTDFIEFRAEWNGGFHDDAKQRPVITFLEPVWNSIRRYHMTMVTDWHAFYVLVDQLADKEMCRALGIDRASEICDLLVHENGHTVVTETQGYHNSNY